MKRIIALLLTLLLPMFSFAQNIAGQGFNILSPGPIANGTDLSIGYLQDIFGVVDGVLHGSGSQIMGAMFGVFNAGALILGGIIIIYTMVVSTLNTANEGEMLGRKWSSIWIPVRSALGIGLLIPKATGYSVIQILMMWIIVQGVGLADSVWLQAINYLTVGGMIVQQSQEPRSDIGGEAQSTFASLACLAGLQQSLNQAQTDMQKQGKTPPAVPNLIATVFPLQPCTTATCSVQIPGTLPPQPGTNINWNALAGVCGTISWAPAAPDINGGSMSAADKAEIEQALKEASTTAVQQIMLDMSGPSQLYVTNNFFQSGTPPGLLTYLEPKMFMDASSDFQGIILPIARSTSSRATDAASVAWLQNARADGWMNAGQWYWQLVSLNSDVSLGNIVTSMEPQTADVDNKLSTIATRGGGDTGSRVYNVLNNYGDAWTNFVPVASALQNRNSYSGCYSYANPDYTSTSLACFMNYATQFAQQNAPDYSGNIPGSGISQDSLTTSLSGFVLQILSPILGPIADLIQITTSMAGLATSQQTNTNPVLMIASIGETLLEMVVQVWIAGAISIAAATAAVSAVPSFAFGTAPNAVVIWIVPLIWAISGVLFVEGAAMTYYIPLIPFILFTFGVIGWFVATIEAMVAAPLVALGITHPEGAEVLGKADPAVLLVVNVFMRPSMMIIGFITGIILSYVSVWVLNRGFWMTWVAAATYVFNPAQNVIAFLFSLPMLILIYVGLVIALLNFSFGLINVIPDKVMRWIGGQVEGVAGEAGKMLGETQQGIRGGAQATGSGIGEVAKAHGAREDKDLTGEATPAKEKDTEAVQTAPSTTKPAGPEAKVE